MYIPCVYIRANYMYNLWCSKHNNQPLHKWCNEFTKINCSIKVVKCELEVKS